MYLALYRKYRPCAFDDVISQEHITTTLKNQITTGQIAHAYLFTGTRGTGKTSCAKIMAKAVNCLSPENGSPCGKCAACKAIEEGSTDIIEIDAASNNGVDNIRQIRDEVIYTPIDCKYKVYIIDEVHMLSSGAFNALLKTLEEPPSHVIFILATTEYYKVPATILSRCQQFLFSKIDPAHSVTRLLEIAEKEGIALEPSAAQLIARLSDGAMRDALSLLDQCISVSHSIDENLVRQCSGAADSEYLFALSRAAIDKAPAEALKLLDSLIVQGKDISRFIEELTAHYRNLMLEKTVGEELIKASDSELEQYRSQCRVYSLDEIMYHIDLISDSLDNINRMKQTGQARLLAEQLLIRLTTPKLTNDAQALASRIGALETQLNNLRKGGFAVAEGNKASDRNHEIAPKEKKEPTFENNSTPLSQNTVQQAEIKEIKQESPQINEITAEKQDSAKEDAHVWEITQEPISEQASEPNSEPVSEFVSEPVSEPVLESFSEYVPTGFDDIPLPPPPPEEIFGGEAYNYESELGQAKVGQAELSTTKSKSEKTELSTTKPKTEKPTEKKPAAVASKASEENTNTSRPIPQIDFSLPNDTNPLPQWQEIITGMPARSRGLLKSSQAYLYDGKIYISATASSEKVLKDAPKAEELRQRAKTVLGGEMEMFILKSAPAAEAAEIDKVTPFLDKVRALGINVTVK